MNFGGLDPEESLQLTELNVMKSNYFIKLLIEGD